MTPAPTEVAFFLPCLNDRVLPRPAIAAVLVLEHLGCRVEFPEAQRCCGQPLYNNGYRDGAAEAARHFIRVFESAPAGLCTCENRGMKCMNPTVGNERGRKSAVFPNIGKLLKRA